MMYNKDKPHTHRIPEIGYIEIMARNGLEDAVRAHNSRQADKFLHILDNLKIVVDKIG